jgi:hypothetical protein
MGKMGRMGEMGEMAVAVNGCWLLAAGCWLLAAGCWLLAAQGYSRASLRGRAAPEAIGSPCFRTQATRLLRQARWALLAMTRRP